MRNSLTNLQNLMRYFKAPSNGLHKPDGYAGKGHSTNFKQLGNAD